jgi:hypothetical protein
VLVLDVRSSLGSIVFTRTAAFSGTFTPSAGGSIAANQLFPSGSYAVTGSISVNAVVTGNQVQQGFPSTQTLTMNVNTTASLFVNSGCSSDASFSSGQIAGAVTGSNQGALSVRFTSCGSGTTTGPGVTDPSGSPPAWLVVTRRQRRSKRPPFRPRIRNTGTACWSDLPAGRRSSPEIMVVKR